MTSSPILNNVRLLCERSLLGRMGKFEDIPKSSLVLSRKFKNVIRPEGKCVKDLLKDFPSTAVTALPWVCHGYNLARRRKPLSIDFYNLERVVEFIVNISVKNGTVFKIPMEFVTFPSDTVCLTYSLIDLHSRLAISKKKVFIMRRVKRTREGYTESLSFID